MSLKQFLFRATQAWLLYEPHLLCLVWPSEMRERPCHLVNLYLQRRFLVFIQSLKEHTHVHLYVGQISIETLAGANFLRLPQSSEICHFV